MVAGSPPELGFDAAEAFVVKECVDEQVNGVDAVLQGVETGNGLACGLRSPDDFCAFIRLAPVGLGVAIKVGTQRSTECPRRTFPVRIRWANGGAHGMA
jgi:hypothetical protein